VVAVVGYLAHNRALLVQEVLAVEVMELRVQQMVEMGAPILEAVEAAVD
jgi:hypothetical protein